MPTGAWSEKRERQYQHVLDSCVKTKPLEVCRKIAAAVVNKTRAEAGESKTVGCHCPRGMRPLKSDKKHCYDPKTKCRRLRKCPAGAKRSAK